MKFYMLVLALDTTTRGGSAAVLRDGTVIGCEIGDAALTHGERLPGDLMRLLDRHGLQVRDIDVFAVAAGPGSLTGMRIGIAAIQGLALANGKPAAAISTLDALNRAAQSTPLLAAVRDTQLIGAWMDGQRGEVFSALYRAEQLLDGPSVQAPDVVLGRWAPFTSGVAVAFVGDGAIAYAEVIRAQIPHASIAPTVPALAPAIAELAAESAARNETVPPDRILPIYIRRSDVELGRDRRAAMKLS
jgi:tRNA threonylcarbamoyladenosine biosynthesis protein TsaB